MRVLTGVKPWVLWRVFYLMGGGGRLGLVGGGLFTDVLGVGIVGVVGVFFVWWWGVGQGVGKVGSGSWLGDELDGAFGASGQGSGG